MLDSIYIGMTGLMGYSRGLKVISNNVANLNTPGFKGSHLQYADLFYSSGDSGSQGGVPVKRNMGLGLNTLSTTLDMRQGEFRQTGNSLDVAVDGEGMFVLRDAEGVLRYTRAGQFEFDKDGLLVSRIDGSKVMALDDQGRLTQVTLEGIRTNPAKASSSVSFKGNLSLDDTDHVVGSVRVFDALGGEHTLGVTFTNQSPTTPGSWTVTVREGTTTIATGTIEFSNGLPVPASSTLAFTYSPTGVPPIALTLDFATDVTSFAAGTTSTLVMDDQNGFASGALASVAFDSQGRLKLKYANGQTVDGLRLALARVDTQAALEPLGGNLFGSRDPGATHIGAAGTESFGNVSAGLLELSNVDLSQEFSDLIITQRGYQAASQIVSTANEMIQVVFDMKARR
jgi:flagellar hook protein FlgE